MNKIYKLVDGMVRTDRAEMAMDVADRFNELLTDNLVKYYSIPFKLLEHQVDKSLTFKNGGFFVAQEMTAREIVTLDGIENHPEELFDVIVEKGNHRFTRYKQTLKILHHLNTMKQLDDNGIDYLLNALLMDLVLLMEVYFFHVKETRGL